MASINIFMERQRTNKDIGIVSCEAEDIPDDALAASLAWVGSAASMCGVRLSLRQQRRIARTLHDLGAALGFNLESRDEQRDL